MIHLISIGASFCLMFIGIWFLVIGIGMFLEETLKDEKANSGPTIVFLSFVGSMGICMSIFALVVTAIRITPVGG